MKTKFLLSLATLTLIGVSGVFISQYSPAQSTAAADLNSDNCIDQADYNLLMSYIRSGGNSEATYDLNGDGSVNRADARTMVASFTNPRGEACPEPVEPEITWTPESLDLTLMAGESTTTEVTFVASEDVENVEVGVSPELEDLVDVSPKTFTSISSGEIVTISIEIYISETELPKPVAGQLSLSGNDFDEVLYTNFPLTLTIEWKELINQNFGIRLYKPPTFYSETIGSKIFLSDSPVEGEGDGLSFITIFKRPVSMASSLSSIRPLFSTEDYAEDVIFIDNVACTKVSGTMVPDAFGWGGNHHTYIVIPRHDGTVLELDYNSADSGKESLVSYIISTMELE